jgi:hypothetical protein
MQKVLITLSEEAVRFEEENGIEALLEAEQFEKGYDYDILEFTDSEANAFIQGVEYANGYINPKAEIIS